MSVSTSETNIPKIRKPFSAELPPRVPYLADGDNAGNDASSANSADAKPVFVQNRVIKPVTFPLATKGYVDEHTPIAGRLIEVDSPANGGTKVHVKVDNSLKNADGTVKPADFVGIGPNGQLVARSAPSASGGISEDWQFETLEGQTATKTVGSGIVPTAKSPGFLLMDDGNTRNVRNDINLSTDMPTVGTIYPVGIKKDSSNNCQLVIGNFNIGGGGFVLDFANSTIKNYCATSWPANADSGSPYTRSVASWVIFGDSRSTSHADSDDAQYVRYGENLNASNPTGVTYDTYALGLAGGGSTYTSLSKKADLDAKPNVQITKSGSVNLSMTNILSNKPTWSEELITCDKNFVVFIESIRPNTFRWKNIGTISLHSSGEISDSVIANSDAADSYLYLVKSRKLYCLAHRSLFGLSNVASGSAGHRVLTISSKITQSSIYTPWNDEAIHKMSASLLLYDPTKSTWEDEIVTQSWYCQYGKYNYSISKNIPVGESGERNVRFVHTKSMVIYPANTQLKLLCENLSENQFVGYSLTVRVVPII